MGQNLLGGRVGRKTYGNEVRRVKKKMGKGARPIGRVGKRDIGGRGSKGKQDFDTVLFSPYN